MFNTKSRESVKDCKLNDSFYKPHSDYNLKYLLNNILDNYDIPVEKTLPKDCFKGSKKYKHTVLIVLDGLGIELFRQSVKLLPKEVKEYLEKKLLISEITSIFPPTTTSVIPFFMTGLFPEESGVYDWYQYEPHIDEVIIPFRDLYREGNSDTEVPVDISVEYEKIFSRSRFHKLLKDNGVKPFVYSDPSYTTSFNTIGNSYANIVEVKRFQEQIVKSVENIEKNYNNKTFHYLYDPNIDGIEHHNGVYTAITFEIVQSLLFEIYQLIQMLEKRNLDDVQILITADHGLTDFSYKDVLYLNKEMDMERYLKRNSKGKIIGFGGSLRDCILHIKDELQDEFVRESSKICKKYGEVFTIEDLYNNSLFNREIVSEKFRKNMGNVIICAYDHRGVWYDSEETKDFRSMHGGLSYDELHVPLINYG